VGLIITVRKLAFICGEARNVLKQADPPKKVMVVGDGLKRVMGTTNHDIPVKMLSDIVLEALVD